jgi:hypothetical protein
MKLYEMTEMKQFFYFQAETMVKVNEHTGAKATSS